MKLPSASALKRTMLCPGSAILPQVGSITEASEKGNVLHEYLALRLTGKSEEAALLAIPAQYHEDARSIDLSGMPEFEWVKTEVAFAYDPSTRVARVLGENIQRDYKGYGLVEDEEFPCTIDWCGKTVDGRLVLGDWKTGNAYTVEAAKDNWQLFLGAICVEYCFAGVEAKTIHAAIARTLGTTRFDWAEYDAFDLELYSDQLDLLKGQLRQMDPAHPKLVEGAHCQYCPAFNACPAKVALMRALSVTPGLLADEVKGMLTPENAALAYARYRAVKAALRKLDVAFQEYAARTPIVLPDGKVYGKKVEEREEIDPQIAWDALAARNYDPRIGLSLDVSKASLERAVRAANPPRGKAAEWMRNLLGAISERGGIVLKRTERLVEHDPKREDE